MKANLVNFPKAFLFSEQKENLAELKELIKNSIDNPPSAEEIQQAKEKFQDIISDGVITPAEKQQIKTGIQDAAESLGITPEELQEIKSTAQDIFGDMGLPNTSDTVVGIDGIDSFLNQNGDFPELIPQLLNINEYQFGSIGTNTFTTTSNNLDPTNLQLLGDIISNVEVNNLEPGFEFI